VGCRVASPGILVAPCSEPPGIGLGEYWNWPPACIPSASDCGAGLGSTSFGGETGLGDCSSLIDWVLDKLRRVGGSRTESLLRGSGSRPH